MPQAPGAAVPNRRGRPAVTGWKGFSRRSCSGLHGGGKKQQQGRGLLAAVAPGLLFPRSRRKFSFNTPKTSIGDGVSGVVTSHRCERGEPNLRDVVLLYSVPVH